MSRNAQGERLPELAEELEKLRAGLAVVGDQAGWKYLRPRCIGCLCDICAHLFLVKAMGQPGHYPSEDAEIHKKCLKSAGAWPMSLQEILKSFGFNAQRL